MAMANRPDRFEIFTAIKIWSVVFLVMAQCSLVRGYKCFEGTYRIRIQGSSSSTFFDYFLYAFIFSSCVLHVSRILSSLILSP
jgi:hypothetical protein